MFCLLNASATHIDQRYTFVITSENYTTAGD